MPRFFSQVASKWQAWEWCDGKEGQFLSLRGSSSSPERPPEFPFPDRPSRETNQTNMGSLHGTSPGNGVNNTGGGNGNGGGGGVSAPVVMMNTLRGVSEGLLAPGVSSPHRVTRAQLKADRPGGPATPSRAGEVVRAQTTPTPARLATTPETQRKTRRSAAAASGATAAETHDEVR